MICTPRPPTLSLHLELDHPKSARHQPVSVSSRNPRKRRPSSSTRWIYASFQVQRPCPARYNVLSEDGIPHAAADLSSLYYSFTIYDDDWTQPNVTILRKQSTFPKYSTTAYFLALLLVENVQLTSPSKRISAGSDMLSNCLLSRKLPSGSVLARIHRMSRL